MINLVFSGLMVVLTISGAIIFLFTDLFTDRVFGRNRYILGVVFLIYAVYRSYRMNLTIKGRKAESEEE